MKNLFRIFKSISPLILIYFIISSFPFLGAECNTLVNGQNVQASDFLYTWTLQRQTGANIDVCPGETVTFHNTYTADLTCPGQNPITRVFAIDVNNDRLTYTLSNQTLAIYRFELVTENGANKLNLYGVNVNRNLFYLRTSADAPIEPMVIGTDNATNSSEVTK